MKRDPLLVAAIAALGDVDLEERYLIDASATKSRWQYGEQNGSLITINPAPHVVDTILHEIVHYLRPQWSEKVLRRRVTQLMRQISHEEVQAIYHEWNERKR